MPLGVVAGCHPAPPRPGDGGPVVLETDPPEGATDVGRARPLRVVYDRPLSPRALGPDSVALRSGDRSLSLRVTVDPAAHALEVRPVSLLDPEIDYRLEVAPLEDLEGFAGEEVVVHFSTGWDDTAAPAPTVAWAEVEALLGARCAHCHGAELGRAGMDLSSPLGVATTAIDVPARGVRASGTVGPNVPGLVGLSRIDPGRPERSYLVYKILGDPHIVGARMPEGEPPLEPEEVALIVHWIAAGAPTE